MLTFARWMFYANGYDKDSKITRLQAWEQAQRSGAIVEALETKPILSGEADYLWEMYTEIKGGCDKIGYIELDAYQRVTGDALEQWEAKLMIQLDLERRTNV